jgi:sulfur carrier protein
VKVRIRHQRREVEIHGPGSVQELLQRLEVNPETVIVIREGELLTDDAALGPDDEVEIRPVVSGGGEEAVTEVFHALHDV